MGRRIEKLSAGMVREVVDMAESEVMRLHGMAEQATMKGIDEVPTEAQVLAIMRHSTALAELADALMFKRVMHSQNEATRADLEDRYRTNRYRTTGKTESA